MCGFRNRRSIRMIVVMRMLLIMYPVSWETGVFGRFAAPDPHQEQNTSAPAVCRGRRY